MARRTLKILEHLLKDFQSVPDYFWTLFIKRLKKLSTIFFTAVVSSTKIEMMERGYPPKLFENDYPSMYHTNKYISNNNDSELLRDVFKEQKHYMENSVNEKNWFLGETIRKVRYMF